MDTTEQQIDLEIEHAHLKGQLAFAKGIPAGAIGVLREVAKETNEAMLKETEVIKCNKN